MLDAEPCETADCGLESTSGDASTTGSDVSIGTSSGSTGEATGATSSESSSTSGESVGDGSEESSSTGEPMPASSERHVARPLGTTAAPRGYWEYLPLDYEENTDSPLLVFWHGISENGDGVDQLARVLREGPPRLIDRDQWPADRPFVVLSPQHPGQGCPSSAEIESFFAYAIEAYDVDPAKVYLTGLSCGAIGGWNYLAQYADSQIAAAVLIAGDGRGAFSSAGCALGTVPIWAFHGDADEVVTVHGTTVPVQSLWTCVPRPDVEMTIYPDVGHASWRQTYDLSAGHDIYAWLLERSSAS